MRHSLDSPVSAQLVERHGLTCIVGASFAMIFSSAGAAIGKLSVRPRTDLRQAPRKLAPALLEWASTAPS
jgi:hypothetical protein